MRVKALCAFRERYKDGFVHSLGPDLEIDCPDELVERLAAEGHIAMPLAAGTPKEASAVEELAAARLEIDRLNVRVNLAREALVGMTAERDAALSRSAARAAVPAEGIAPPALMPNDRTEPPPARKGKGAA